MNLVHLIFSPTGGTRRAAEALTQGWDGPVRTVDLTDPAMSPVTLSPEDVAVISIPSYGGRVPALAAQRLGKVQGGGAAAVLLCVYGNRAFEDTLVEMADLAKAGGFRVAAAAAAIAEHSILRQFAAGRPDDADRAQLASFWQEIMKKLESGQWTEPAIPGNRPYKKAGGGGMTPAPTKECASCGLCARQCPAGAIDPADPGKVNKGACISCMRCVAVCPNHARKLNGLMLAGAEAMLKKVCSQRKENELFL